MSTKKKFHLVMILGTAALLFSMAAALCLGQYAIPFHSVIAELFGNGSTDTVHTVLFNVRLPRILFSVLAGAGLSASGLAFQCLFANPLATPDTLGTANGASFGAALGILLGFSSLGTQALAFAMGILAVALVFLVTRSSKAMPTRSMVFVILAGMVISSLFSALVSLIKYVADPQDQLPVITFWLMGSFSSVTRRSLLTAAPMILIGISILILLRFRLNMLSLSEEEARSLGVNLPAIRGLVIASAAAVTAAVVAVCGVIGWVGLLVPHIARMLLGNDNRRCLPACLVLGGLFLLVTDTVARCATAAEIPVSILTSVIGAPVFIGLLRKTGGIRT